MVIKDKNGFYDGDVNMSNRPHGNGIMTSSNGDRYEGTWRDGRKHGFGKLFFIDGSLYEGQFALKAGIYDVKVASANNNTKSQGGNTNTMNPADTSTHDTIIGGVVTVKGGGAGTTSGYGKGGGTAVFEITPVVTFVDKNGTSGRSGSGGKGSSANWTHNGGESIYLGHGKGQGCSTSEYASSRRWIAGNNGYAKIELISNKDNYTRYENVIV